MEKKYIFGFVAFAMVAILGVSMVSAMSFGNGFMRHDLGDDERIEMRANADALRTAIEEGDYDAWKSLMEEQISLMRESLTEENFDEIVARHQEMEANRADFEGEFGEKGHGFHREMGECPMIGAE